MHGELQIRRDAHGGDADDADDANAAAQDRGAGSDRGRRIGHDAADDRKRGGDGRLDCLGCGCVRRAGEDARQRQVEREYARKADEQQPERLAQQTAEGREHVVFERCAADDRTCVQIQQRQEHRRLRGQKHIQKQ